MSTSVQALITQAAQSGGVDPTLALAVAQRESNFSQGAVGAAGEQGVFQIMPSTAQDLGIDPANLQQNIAGGTALLSHLLGKFGGDQAKALAAYNCGETCVQNAIARGGDNWYSYIPASSYQYVVSILGSMPAPTPSSGASADSSASSPASPTITPAAGATAGIAVLVGAGILAFLALQG